MTYDHSIGIPVMCTLIVVAVSCQYDRSYRPGVNGKADSILIAAAHVRPSSRQVEWQEMEMTCFIHFGINTFYDVEWGNREQEVSMFNPTELDTRQWARTVKEAGAKMMIVLAKHHDGFCYWPSRFTGFSVKNSPWKQGQGDLIAEAAAACREYGLKLGIYLSPWDIHSPLYGTAGYNDYFKNQLRELLTAYGKVSEVWLDGACGEGPNGKRQVYDWMGYFRLIRELQPHAVIAIMGPDVRWVGTETGYGRETEWSVLPVDNATMNQIALTSMYGEKGYFFMPLGNLIQDDLGSREKIMNAGGLIWYPSEVNVSIRPGWFYHEAHDSLVKSPEELVDIYYGSVGRNSLLLLNLPPNKRGLIHENDVLNIRKMRALLDETFRHNLAEKATIRVHPRNRHSDPSHMIDDDPMTWWNPGAGIMVAQVEFDMENVMTFDRMMLQENFRNGQRVEEFVLEIKENGRWVKITGGTTIGYKRLLRFNPVHARKVRLRILSSRDTPEISSFGLYKAPAE